MRIGIFSKLGASGGSEHRASEMGSAIVQYTKHEAVLLCEQGINRQISDRVDKRVPIIRNVFQPKPTNVDALYDVDVLLVINSDSYSFSKLDYWMGKTEHHAHQVDLSRIKRMAFLYNFIITPSKHLHELEKYVDDIRIICANTAFFNEISEKDKFNKIKHFPRTTLDSPINIDKMFKPKTDSDKIRIGKHSKALGYKFNDQHKDLIGHMNDKYGDKISWDFLGVPGDRANEISTLKNVTIRPEYSIDVGEYLSNIDIFLFFISWHRQEPWSRAVAEGMASGCPIIATNCEGNRNQVMHGNNGFVCGTLEEMEKHLSYLIDNRDMARRMGRNNIIYSHRFSSENIIKQFVDFISYT